jgi:protein-tyrosine phosphatase
MLFRDFDPEGPGADVPDPYYAGGDAFDEVLAIVERTADTLASRLADLLASDSP